MFEEHIVDWTAGSMFASNCSSSRGGSRWFEMDPVLSSLLSLFSLPIDHIDPIVWYNRGVEVRVQLWPRGAIVAKSLVQSGGQLDFESCGASIEAGVLHLQQDLNQRHGCRKSMSKRWWAMMSDDERWWAMMSNDERWWAMSSEGPDLTPKFGTLMVAFELRQLRAFIMLLASLKTSRKTCFGQRGNKDMMLILEFHSSARLLLATAQDSRKHVLQGWLCSSPWWLCNHRE